ncbi:MAG: hypothetical protein ACRDRW_08975 [Pseudonocardiaceae bacterium]
MLVTADIVMASDLALALTVADIADRTPVTDADLATEPARPAPGTWPPPGACGTCEWRYELQLVSPLTDIPSR